MNQLKERMVPQRLVYIVDPEYVDMIQKELKSALQMLCILNTEMSQDGHELTILFLATDAETETANQYINNTYDFIGN